MIIYRLWFTNYCVLSTLFIAPILSTEIWSQLTFSSTVNATSSYVTSVSLEAYPSSNKNTKKDQKMILLKSWKGVQKKGRRDLVTSQTMSRQDGIELPKSSCWKIDTTPQLTSGEPAASLPKCSRLPRCTSIAAFNGIRGSCSLVTLAILYRQTVTMNRKSQKMISCR